MGKAKKETSTTTYLNPGLQEVLKHIYPETTGIYVISKQLWDNFAQAGGEFYKFMLDYIGTIPDVKIDNYNFNDKTASIQAAMNFLRQVIINERNKENNFINWLNKETDITAPSISSDWSTFIKTFNETLKQGQNSIILFQNEINRLNSNINAIKIHSIDEQGKAHDKQIRAILSEVEYTSEKLGKVAEYLSGQNNETGKTILEIVLKNYGATLIKLSITNAGNDIELDQGKAKSLILTISQMLIKDFYNNKINDFNKNNKANKFSDAFIEEFTKYSEIIKDDTSNINQQILALINNIKELPFLTQDLMRNFKIENEIIQIPQNSFSIDSLNEITNDNFINNILRFTLNDFSPTIKLVKNQNALSEISVSIESIAEGALSGINPGSVGAKTDNILGWLIIEPQENLSSKQIAKINETKKLIHDKINELTKTLKSDNTLKYYNNQEKNWQKTIKEISDLLKILKNTYNILSECFVIEESTKSYTSLNTPDAINKGTSIGGKDGVSFKGGSLGSNIYEQIQKISALRDYQLINQKQADWLVTATINCGPGLILENMKTSLENYFSIFATILLFDDQRAIANEISNQLTNDLPSSKTTVQTIHVFTLNNGTYPLSYVLTLTYEVLVKLYGIVESDISPTNVNGGGGATVNIKGFINPDKVYPPNTNNGLTKDRLKAWEELSQEAIKSVSMEVHFLTNFLAVLNSLGVGS